jgi:gluconate 5-dehydrogenase
MIDAARGLDLFSLKDKVFVVTGASSGIGLAIARGLAAAGATVGLNSRSRERLEACAADIPGSLVLPFDVADLAAAEAALGGVIEGHGRLDGLVCNAAARDRRPLEAIAPDDFRALLDTNLVSPFQLARLVAPHMIERGHGRIIFLTSLAGRFALPGDPAYAGTKGGLAGLVSALAVELGPRGVNVNGIAPGPIASETNKPFVESPDWRAVIERNVPLGRWGDPDELAGAAIFLASDASSYVNGHVVTVDGGASVKMFS